MDQSSYTPSATWHGYETDEWPRVEDGSAPLEGAHCGLKKREEAPLWPKFLAGGTVGVTLCLVVLGAIPKSELAMLPSYFESLFWSWF